MPVARVHGGAGPDLDFSASINVHGPPREVVEAIRDANYGRYPDVDGAAARRAIAEVHRCGEDEVVVAAGATPLLYGLAELAIRGGPTAVIVEPTFEEYRAAIESRGGQVNEWRAREGEDFAVDIPAVIELGREASSVYLCRPNNPTGCAIAWQEVMRVAGECPSTLVILDESYLSLSDYSHESSHPVTKNTVRVRSLTKDLGLPGLRIGYALADPPIAEGLRRLMPPWGVSSAGLRVMEKIGQLSEFIDRSRSALLHERSRIARRLSDLGLTPIPSATGFQLVRVGDGEAFSRALFSKGIGVRDASSFGLPEHVRIAARTAAEGDRLIAAIESMEPW